jgi:hypothetical protein
MRLGAPNRVFVFATGAVIVIWPEASRAQNNMAAVSAEGSTVWVLIRRLNSSCNRSIPLDVRIDFHWLSGKRGKVNSLSPAIGDGFALLPPLADERLALRLDLLLRAGVDHILVVGPPRLPSTRILCAICLTCSRGKRGSFAWTNSMLTDGFFPFSLRREASSAWHASPLFRPTTCGVQLLRPQAFNVPNDRAIRPFRQPVVPARDSRKHVFSGFQKCCYPYQRFQSNEEREFAVLIRQQQRSCRAAVRPSRPRLCASTAPDRSA